MNKEHPWMVLNQKGVVVSEFTSQSEAEMSARRRVLSNGGSILIVAKRTASFSMEQTVTRDL